MVGFLLAGPGMHILKKLQAFSYHALALLKVELVLEVVDPWVGAWAAYKDEVSRFQIARPQLPGRANDQPVA